MLRIALTLTPILVVLLYSFSFFVTQVRIVDLPKVQNQNNYLFDYKGVLNVMSNKSIGSKSPEEIIESAQSADLDFIFLSDLNRFDHPWDKNGYYGKTLFSVSQRFDYLDSRLIFFQKESTQAIDSLGSAQVLFTDLLSQDRDSERFLIQTHPRLSKFSLKNELLQGLTGAELYNLKSIFESRRKSRPFSIFLSVLFYPLHPDLALIRLFEFPSEEIKWIDSLDGPRVLNSYLGLEATANPLPLGGLATIRIPSYEQLFRSATNHVLLRTELTGNYWSDRAKILDGLFGGKLYMSFDSLGDPQGFYAEVVQKGRRFLFGDTLTLDDETTLLISTPQFQAGKMEIEVYRNGEPYKMFHSPLVQERLTEPGVYRVLVWAHLKMPFPEGTIKVPWITSNSFQVLK